MRVAVRELKANLSKVLACAQAGEEVEVLSRNKPVARIVGIKSVADTPLQRLVAEGALSGGDGKLEACKPVKLPPGKTMSEIVIEDRG